MVMASRLALPSISRGSPKNEALLQKAVGSRTPGSMTGCHESQACRVIGPNTPGSYRRRKPSEGSSAAGTAGARGRCSKQPAVPGFGLSRARSDSNVALRRARRMPLREKAGLKNCTSQVRAAMAGMQESMLGLKSLWIETLELFNPPSQLRNTSSRACSAPFWMYYMFVISSIAALACFLLAFWAAPLTACPESTLPRYAHLVLMGTFMFMAGALLAMDDPSRCFMFRML